MKTDSAGRDEWMSPPDYGRSIRIGLGINLLVRDVARGVKFAERVLGATATFADKDFAVLRACGSEWMLHADHTYRNNPVRSAVEGLAARGGGVEIRLYGCDPDQAEAAARAGGYTILAPSMDKPHGLRECILVDEEGYVWVPGVRLPKERDPPG